MMNHVRFSRLALAVMLLCPFGVAQGQDIQFDFADANAHQSGVDAQGNIVDIIDQQSTANVNQWSAFVDTTGGFGGISSSRASIRPGGTSRTTLVGTVVEASVSSGFGRFADGDSDVFVTFEVPETFEVLVTVTGDSTGVVNLDQIPKFGYINFGQIAENALEGLIVECDGRTLLDYYNEGGDGRFTASGTVTVVAFTYGIELVAVSDRKNFESSMSSVRIVLAPDQTSPSSDSCSSTLITELNNHNAYETNITLSDGTLMVGDPSADIDGMVNSGAVYVYQHDGENWELQQTLQPLTPSSGALFGQNVEMLNDIAVIAGSNSSGNSVRIFRTNGAQWAEESHVPIPDISPSGFGDEIAIHRNSLGLYDVLVSEPYLENGRVHVIRETVDHQWLVRPPLNGSDGFGSDSFGAGLAVSEGMLLVGSPTERIPFPDLTGTNTSNGYMYVYEYETDTLEGWNKIGKISASDAGQTGDFGSAVSIDGDLMVVGAPFSTNNWTGGQGSAYIYRYDGEQWLEEQKVVSTDGGCKDDYVLFGSHVSVSGETVLISASGSGKTYAFRDNGSSWVEQSDLFLINAEPGDDVSSHISSTWVALLLDGLWNIYSIECTSGSCIPDLTNDGELDIFDVFAFIEAFNSMDPSADFTDNGVFDIFDVFAFLDSFNTGCP